MKAKLKFQRTPLNCTESKTIKNNLRIVKYVIIYAKLPDQLLVLLIINSK